jgi:hypothetical protein
MKSMKEKNNNVIVIPTQSGHTQVWHRLAECTYNDSLESCPYTRVLLHSRKNMSKAREKEPKIFGNKSKRARREKKSKCQLL